MKRIIFYTIVLMILLSSCASLAKEAGYQKSTINTDWKIRKL